MRTTLGGLLIAWCADLQAASLVLDTLPTGLAGAGCVYSFWDDTGTRPVLVVDARSKPDDRKGVARLKVDGVLHTLDRVSEDDQAPVYANAELEAQIAGLVEIEPICRSSECEGSFYRGRLEVRRAEVRIEVEVRAHCGN